MIEPRDKALEDFDAGLADELNTAVALADAFDFVREAKIAMDSGGFGEEDVAAAQEFLNAFDEIFAVVKDNDAEKLKELGVGGADQAVPDDWIEAKVAERQAARQRRDFAKSDEKRQELSEHGIILEDKKDRRVRRKRTWKRQRI